MEYFIIYLVLGIVVSIVLTEIDKIIPEDEEEKKLNNTDRLLYIVIWPIMIYLIGKELFSAETINK